MSIRNLLPSLWQRNSAGNCCGGTCERRENRDLARQEYHTHAALDQQFDALVRSVFGDYDQVVPFGGGPRLNLSENDREVLVEVEAPGMAASDFEVSVDQGYLILKGQRRSESTPGDQQVRYRESSTSAWQRVIALPDAVLADQAKAEYRRGILQVRLPKDAAKAASKRIPVQAA